MFLVNSRQESLAAALSERGQALSQSYGRCFAEFLNEGSLVRLSTLMLTHLCRFAVRLPISLMLEVFLGPVSSHIGRRSNL